MGKRQDSRDRIEAQIVELGRRHLVTEGAAGLSLRAIARDLGMVSSAVYRYVASRDDLLTLLLVDAYSELADAVDARPRRGRPDWRARDRGDRARAPAPGPSPNPASWALLYGSPVPGYHAPAERTVGPGTRVVGALFDAVAAGIAAGDIGDTRIAVRPTTFGGLRPAARRVRLSRRRCRGRQVLRAVGRAGRRDQPGGVRPVRGRHADRPGAVVRSPGPDCWLRLLDRD